MKMLTSDKIFKFGEEFCFCTGDFAGQPFRFLDWQKDIIRNTYDPKMPDGRRYVQKAIWELPRKTGKTQLVAILLLYHLVFEENKEIYSCSASKDQAATVFKMAKSTVQASPMLSEMLTVQRNIIYNKKRKNVYQALSSDGDKQHGRNPSIVFFDEAHAIKDGGNLYRSIDTGMMARKEPLIITITSAGSDTSVFYYQQHLEAKQWIAGAIKKERFYAKIYGLEPSEDWQDESNWYKANPSLGKTTEIGAYRQAYAEAKLNKSNEGGFRNYNLNQWVQGSVEWITMEQWGALKDDSIRLEDFEGEACVMGLDLATISDLPALSMVFFRDGIYYIFCVQWICSESLQTRLKNEHSMFADWVDAGWIRVIDGPVVNLMEVRKQVLELCKRFNVLELNIDPNRFATEITQQLCEDGVNVVKHRQRLIDFTNPVEVLEGEVLKGTIRHDGNGALAWNFCNVKMESDHAGNRKPTKNADKNRIDGVIALLMAMGRAQTLLKQESTSFEDLLQLANNINIR